MALSYKSRRRWSMVILIVGLPLYVVAALVVLALINDNFGRPNILVELAVYVLLGLLWIMPFKSVFRGVGQADPDADDETKKGEH